LKACKKTAAVKQAVAGIKNTGVAGKKIVCLF
jgi:hypothetical protein